MEIGASYIITFPPYTSSKMYVLLAAYDCTERHHDQYTFLDSWGTKITFTRGSFEKLEARKYVAPKQFIPLFEETDEVQGLRMQTNVSIHWDHFKK